MSQINWQVNDRAAWNGQRCQVVQLGAKKGRYRGKIKVALAPDLEEKWVDCKELSLIDYNGFKVGDSIVENGNNPAWGCTTEALIKHGEIIGFHSIPGCAEDEIYPFVRYGDGSEGFAVWDWIHPDTTEILRVAAWQDESAKALEEVTQALLAPQDENQAYCEEAERLLSEAGLTLYRFVDGKPRSKKQVGSLAIDTPHYYAGPGRVSVKIAEGEGFNSMINAPLKSEITPVQVRDVPVEESRPFIDALRYLREHEVDAKDVATAFDYFIENLGKEAFYDYHLAEQMGWPIHKVRACLGELVNAGIKQGNYLNSELKLVHGLTPETAREKLNHLTGKAFPPLHVVFAPDRHFPYEVSQIKIAEVLTITPTQVRLKFADGKEKNIRKQRLRCLLVRDWVEVWDDFYAFSEAVKKLGRKLDDLPKYEVELANTPKSTSLNPLCDAVIVALRPSDDRTYSLGNWGVPQPQYHTISRHTTKMVELASGELKLQASVYCCLKRSDWEYIEGLYSHCVELGDRFIQYWNKLKTWEHFESEHSINGSDSQRTGKSTDSDATESSIRQEGHTGNGVAVPSSTGVDRGGGGKVPEGQADQQTSSQGSGSGDPELTVVDLFAGAGGFRLGMEWAGFKTLGVCDLLESNIETHRVNFPSCERLIAGDIRHIKGVDLTTNSTPLVVVGGPPCQSFSHIGKQDLDDERSQLIFEFARMVGELRPCYWVMENVPGLLQPKFAPLIECLMSKFDFWGYEVLKPVILNCADYGVPQARKRVFFFGWLKGMPPLEVPKPVDFRVTVGQALMDLPNASDYPELREADQILFEQWPILPKSQYSQFMRQPPKGREWNPLLLTNTRVVNHGSEMVAKFALTRPGKTEPDSRKLRLDPGKPSRTLRAGSGSYSAPWPLHPIENRTLTLREGARLSSFPDWFTFTPGNDARLGGGRQIGNALPPLMGFAIGKMIRSSLKKNLSLIAGTPLILEKGQTPTSRQTQMIC